MPAFRSNSARQHRCPGEMVSRRELLRVGSVALAGLSLTDLLRADEEKNTSISAQADNCIILHLNGGPSHLDMWDMKPQAPEKIRGEFKPIGTSLPGVQFSEHLPKLAQQMHRCTLVRSMHHSVNNSHAAAVYVSLTGHDRGEFGGGALPTDNPSIGAVAALLRPAPRNVAPHAVLPYMTKEGAKGPPQPGFFAGFMGRGYDPLWILKDPNAKGFTVPEFTLPSDVSIERVAARGALLTKMNARLLASDAHLRFDALDRLQHQANDILTSQQTQAAFRIQEEPEKRRDAYGRNIYGQSVLLARRLIESGTRVVTVSWAPDANATWDTHGGNFKKLKNTLLPQFDAACSSLLADLAERGMLERTIVAVLGDFGRSPKVNANAGRDHWNYCYSLLLAGGGFKAGSVYGASDKTGAFPADAPLSPSHIIATLYHQLGIDPRSVLYDRLKRPHRLITSGGVVPELLV